MAVNSETKGSAVFLCVDAGTTRFKAAAITEKGNIVAKSEYYYSGSKEQYHEYSVSEFIEALTRTLKRIVTGIDKKYIIACGITGHGPTLIPIDRDKKPLSTGVGYLDERVKKYVLLLMGKKTDRITSTMYIPIALFFKEEFPDIYNNTYKFLQVFDYLAFLLTGEYTASSSSSGIKPWDSASLDQARLDVDKFPEIHYMGEKIGHVIPRASRIFGLPQHIPVFAVGVDFAAALVGTNTLAKGKSCERSGSSGGINLCWDKPVKDNRLLSYEHFISGLWNVAGITSTSGKAIDWINKIIGLSEFAFPEKRNMRDEIIFLPYLKGERTPLWNPYAKGIFYGLTAQHTKEDLLFSVYLGIVFSLRDCIEIIEENRCSFHLPIVTTGWGAKNDLFVQLKSDVTGKSFTKMQSEDAELLGIAIILAASTGYYDDLTAAAEHITREQKIFLPDAKWFKNYTEVFQQYKSLQNKLFEHY
jgi:xylulokinase